MRPGNKVASSVLSVDKSGRLHTHAVSGTAAVLVTVHEEFGVNQTILVHVEASLFFVAEINPFTPKLIIQILLTIQEQIYE